VASPGASLPRRVRYSPAPPINCTGRGCQTIMLLPPPTAADKKTVIFDQYTRKLPTTRIPVSGGTGGSMELFQNELPVGQRSRTSCWVDGLEKVLVKSTNHEFASWWRSA
jgi:hypothetical protein